jgi:hypothetical membrane protein
MAGIDLTAAKSRFLRIAAWCGLAGPVISAVMIFHSITVSPWFNWHRDALSKVGVSANAIWFNAGVFVGGVLTAVLAVGVGRWIGRGWLGRVGCAAVLVGAIALAMVGVFPEDHVRPHFLVATTYFLATPLGFMLLGMAMLRKGRQVHGALTVCAGVAALLALTRTPHDGYAVPEILASLIVHTWTFSMGMNLLVGDSVP